MEIESPIPLKNQIQIKRTAKEMALTTIDPSEVERFVSSVWSMSLALSSGGRSCGEVLRGMSSFLNKFADTFDRGSPEQLCVKSHNAVLRQLISMSLTSSGIPVADLRHVGKSILEYICIDLLFDDGEFTDEEDDIPPPPPHSRQQRPSRPLYATGDDTPAIFPLHPNFSQGGSVPAVASSAPSTSSSVTAANPGSGEDESSNED